MFSYAKTVEHFSTIWEADDAMLCVTCIVLFVRVISDQAVCSKGWKEH
jgi:hypothetical protein